jgi:glycosyltransferase involved in cell wall biosynthesis
MGKKQALCLSILMPVYNEKFTVEQVVDEVMRTPLPADMQREVVIVDDASTDGTGTILKELQQRYVALKVIHHERNRGKGAALRTAIAVAGGDFMICQDADLEYSPSDYTKLLQPLLHGDADVVYGSRFLPSEYRRVLFFWHSLGNRVLTTISNALNDLNLTDMETCYKMVRAELLRSIPIRSNRFGIEPELTAKFAKRGCRIYEVPVTYRGRTYDEGKKITWKDGISALCTMLYFTFVDDLYNEKYGHNILHRLSSTHRFNRWMADTIMPWVGDNVLEIGAGMGNLTKKMLPRSSYLASDIDPLYLDYLNNAFTYNQRVQVTKVDVTNPADFASFAGKFDTVICLNVIEHVEPDMLAMKNIYEVLRPGGRACILVPRAPRLYGKLDEVLGHVRRYTASDLTDKLEQTGFTIEQVFTFNRVAVPVWWYNGRILKRKTFGKLQLKIYDSFVWLWRYLDRIFPWGGISLIAIARKM